MSVAHAFAAFDQSAPLGPFTLERREPGSRDVQIDILFCGVCHSDLHTVKSEWAGTAYPCVPGHEIAGRVTHVGADVTRFKIGDLAAVGCMVDSCRTCRSCSEGLEQYCDKGATIFTYNTPDPHRPGERTYGGYSSQIVVDEAFCLTLSKALNTAAAAPLLCAGITTYSPLRHWGAGPGKKVGIVGLGVICHMGVKFAHAFVAETVMFTTSQGKVADGTRLGADAVVISSDAAAMKAQANSFDLIVNTVSFSHRPLTRITWPHSKRDGALVLLGAPACARIHLSNYGQFIFKGGGSLGNGSLIPAASRKRQEMPRLLRRARDRLRYRVDPDTSDQRGLRADAEKRREVPLRDRHGVADDVVRLKPDATHSLTPDATYYETAFASIARYSVRAIPIAPSDARCSVHHCTSSRRMPPVRMRSTRSHQRDLRGVRLEMKHGLAGEKAIDADAVEPSRQLAVTVERFHAVRPTTLVQGGIGRNEIFADPAMLARGIRAYRPGSRARSRVSIRIPSPLCAHAHGPRHLQAVERENAARIRRPPAEHAGQPRSAFHREDTLAICVHDRRRLEIASDTDEVLVRAFETPAESASGSPRPAVV